MALLLPRTQTSLRAAFQADHLLLGTTYALLLVALIPLFLSPIMPFSDMG